LHSPGDLARQSAAQSIAKIANIELRQSGGWPELLPRLVRSCVDAAVDFSVRSSAYRCVAYTLEDLVRVQELQGVFLFPRFLWPFFYGLFYGLCSPLKIYRQICAVTCLLL
jgi:hypothetical protein